MTNYARATEFETKAVYYPEVRPGHTAWVSLFQFGNGDIGLSFSEVRRGKNPNYMPPPLDFVESMGLPYRFNEVYLPASNPDMISEQVYMKSSDNGRTWNVTARNPVWAMGHADVGFPDGRIVRANRSHDYRYEQGDSRHCMVTEESLDGGNTWREISRILEGYSFYVHKLKKLRDGSLVAAGRISPGFGPGGSLRSRLTRVAGEIRPVQSLFVISRDGGHTWDGPHYILPGIEAWEPDFVELPNGDLLFVNCTVQAGRAARQIVRRTLTGYVNEPLMEIRLGVPLDDNVQGGITPESITLTPDGLIVGARRGDPYTCSKDLGENWYEIAGVPRCEYQPIIELLPDGSFLSAWHFGADNVFGEYDMYIGTHSFSLKADLPEPTRLTLEREIAEDGSRYVNVWKAILTANGEPVAGSEVKFRAENVWREDGKHNATTLDESENVYPVTTDEHGTARLNMAWKDRVPDIHDAYSVDVVFDPEPGSPLQACRGSMEFAYGITPARNNPANYPAYLNHGVLMVTSETSERFSDLPEIVKKLDRRSPHTEFAKWVEFAGSESRAREVVDFLTANNIISADGNGGYSWYKSAHSGEELIKEVRVCHGKEYIV